jgi:hypothetical protein
VVVNKFSKQEAAGRGLRAEIADAVTAGLPLLTAVPDTCYGAWMGFTGGFGTTLLCDHGVIEDWWQERSRRAALARIAAQSREAEGSGTPLPTSAAPAGAGASVRPSPLPLGTLLSDNHVR